LKASIGKLGGQQRTEALSELRGLEMEITGMCEQRIRVIEEI
jgi:hypothetical protein